MKTLPLRPRPRPGESPTSLLCRLAARSGQLQVAAFARWIGVDPADVASGRSNARLAELSGLSSSEIDEWSARHPSGGMVVYRGSKLVLQLDWLPPQGRTHGGSYCPLCLSEDLSDASPDAGPEEQRAYWRSHWDVTTVRSCHRHSVLLNHLCPKDACEAPVLLAGSMIHCCFACGGDLRRAPTKPLPTPYGRFQTYVRGRIGIGASMSVRWLDELHLHQAEECCWRLGSATRRVSQSHLDHTRQNPIEFQIAYDEGMAICEGGRAAVEAMLDRLADHPDNRSGGPIGAYGSFYRWLDIKELWPNLGDDDVRKAAYRGGC